MSNEIPNTAFKYASGFYLVCAGYVLYAFAELGKFLGAHVTPASVNPYAFSVNNPNFLTINRILAVIFTLIVVYSLFAWQRLRDYTVDSGDELTRVSWTEFHTARKSTMIVIALSTVSAIFLFVADLFFVKIINLIMKTATSQ